MRWRNRQDTVRDLFQQGASISAIAATLHLTRGTLRRYLCGVPDNALSCILDTYAPCSDGGTKGSITTALSSQKSAPRATPARKPACTPLFSPGGRMARPARARRRSVPHRRPSHPAPSVDSFSRSYGPLTRNCSWPASAPATHPSPRASPWPTSLAARSAGTTPARLTLGSATPLMPVSPTGRPLPTLLA